MKIEDLDFTQYDIVYMAGGWGAAYDLGFSDLLGQKISQAYAADVVLGSVCHGVLGFLRATDENGNPLVQGYRMTGVTDKQVQELGITITPQHPERELRAAGSLYESDTAFRDMFASHVVVDGTLVTGQNQNEKIFNRKALIITGVVIAMLGVALIMSGLLVGRTTSLIADGLPNPKLWTSLVIELIFAVWGFGLVLKNKAVK